jgi:PAS domain S-box-containing protein
VISIVPLLGLVVFYLEVPRLRQQAFADLSAIAELKVGQLEAWLDERRGDATVLSASPSLIDNVFRAAGAGDATARQGIIERLEALKSAYAYDGLAVVDADSRQVLALGPEGRALEEPVREALRAAFRSGRVEMTDLYRDASGRVHLDFVAPLAKEIGGGREMVGAAILDAPFARFVFPLIQTWPTPSPSAETLLVRRDVDRALYLNELRHRKGTALVLSLPLEDSRLPAARAVTSGTAQVFEGTDYRGIDVLAAMRPVRSTPWHLVAKIDRDEVLAPLRNLVSWVGLVAMTAALLFGLLILLLWRQQLRAHGLELAAQATEKDRLLRLFFDLPFVGMAIADAHSGRWLQLNDRLCEILGYTRQELAAKTWTQLAHPDEVAADLAQMEQMPNAIGDGHRVEHRFVRKDGQVITATVDVRGVRRAQGDVELFVATIQDITERKRTEEAARRAESFAREVLDNVNQGFAVYDSELRFVAWNRFLERSIGLPREAVIGKHLDEVFPKAREHGVEACLRRALAGEALLADSFVARLRGTTEMLSAEEAAALRDDPRLFWTSSSYAPHRNADGGIEGVLVNVLDVTALKRSQDSLMVSNERLRQLTQHLERVREEERVRIARELHDDLGSMLTGVKWALGMALDQAAAPFDEQLAHASGLLDSAVDTMRRIISDLRPSVLDQLGVWAAIEWYAGQIQLQTDLQCRVSIPEEIAGIDLDPERATAVFRIVQEALTNVLRHAKASRAEIRARREADEFVITVEDDGVGIRDEALAKAGSWGLLGMQERATRFGGEIRFVGAPEGGTALTLRIPVAAGIARTPP